MSREKCRADAMRWLSQATADLRAARNSLGSGSFEWACFQSQQAGEKALKALWYFHAADPWGHSMVRLVREFPVEPLQARLLEILELAKRLDKLYIPTRYPNGLPDLTPAEVFTAEEAGSAIDAAERVLDLVSGLLH